MVDDLLPLPSWEEQHAARVVNLITRLEQRQDLHITKLNWSTGLLIAVTSTPCPKAGASHPHEWAFLLRWRLPPEHQVVRLVLHRLHRHWLSASPAVASQSGIHQERGFCSWQMERECTVVKHGSVFTRGTELPRNPQALFRCQCTRTRIPGLSRL